MQKQYRPIRPVDSDRTLGERDKFGAYRHGGRKHAGIDIYAERHTAVKAGLDGKVVRATGKDGHGSYGGLVIIDHTPDIKPVEDPSLRCYIHTLYAHLDSVSVSLGQKVRQGDIIGKVGNTGNAKGMDPHLHFEAIRAPENLKWKPQENTGIEAGLYRIDPMDFFGGFSLPEECFEPFTSKEMDKFYKDIKTDLRLGPRPALLIDLPNYREFIRNERGEYPDPNEKPSKIKLKFENAFSPEFHSLFPFLELEVNGMNLGRIQTDTKVYELDIWR